ncbi:uncharacterized protein LOC144594901 [Rhinoraja longicauda]
MDLCLTFYLYFILHLCLHSAETFVDLDCGKSVTGRLHEDTILPCKISTPGPIHIKLTKLHQDGIHYETLVSNSSENIRRGQGRIQLRRQDEHDLSLIIHNTELSDNGTYEYFVNADHGYDVEPITLIVEAFVNLDCEKSVTGRLHEDTILPCKINIPDPIHIKLTKLHQDGMHNETLVSNSSENVRRGQGRIQLRGQDEHDVSLIIHNTELSDNGTYQYTVQTDHGIVSVFITLIIEGLEQPKTNSLKEKERTGVGVILAVVLLMLLIFSAMFYFKTKLSRALSRRLSETSRTNLIVN